MPIILGIDPGKNGALAKLDTDAATLAVFDMPTYTVTRTKTKTHVDLELVKEYCLEGGTPDLAWIEEVFSSPQTGVVGAFSFGAHFAGCRGVLVGLGVPTHLVLPQSWKAGLRVPADKTLARARASELFPHCADLWARSTQDGRAEAAMIALYGAILNHSLPSKPVTPCPASAMQSTNCSPNISRRAIAKPTPTKKRATPARTRTPRR